MTVIQHIAAQLADAPDPFKGLVVAIVALVLAVVGIVA